MIGRALREECEGTAEGPVGSGEATPSTWRKAMNLRSTRAAPLLLLACGVGLAQANERDWAAAERLAENTGCLRCHSVAKHKGEERGPAFRDIAVRYRNDDAARDKLIAVLTVGGKGNWPEIAKGAPMAPYFGRLSASEISVLIDWILSLEARAAR